MDTASLISRIGSIKEKKTVKYEKLFVTLNLDGKKIQMLKSSFEELPIYFNIVCATANIIEKTHSTEYFLENHDYSSFVAILYYFRNKELHVPPDVCMNIFRRELQFWDINEEALKTCCFVKYSSFYADQDAAKKFRQRVYLSDVDTITKKMSPWKAWIYKLLNTRSIFRGDVWAVIYRFVTIAAVLFLVSNLYFKVDHTFDEELTVSQWSEFYENHMDELYELCTGKPQQMTTALLKVCDNNREALKRFDSNFINDDRFSSAIKSRNDDNCPNCSELPKVGRLPDYHLFLETSCILFFIVCYILKFIVAPVKKEFVFNFYSIIEIVTIMTYFVFLATRLVDRRFKYQLNAFVLLFGTSRMLLIFHLTKSSKHFQVLTYSIAKCLTDVLLIIIFFLMAGGVFTIIILSAEFAGHIHDKSINPFEAYWATIGIMTTNSFKDFPSEHNHPSLAVAGMLTIIGILFLSISIPVFVDEFGFNLSIYKNEQFMKRLKKEKEEHIIIDDFEKHNPTIFTAIDTDDTFIDGSELSDALKVNLEEKPKVLSLKSVKITKRLKGSFVDTNQRASAQTTATIKSDGSGYHDAI